jgi:hypothetical protein
MNRIFKQTPYSRLHKSEFRNLVKEVLGVVNVFTPLIVLIKTLLDRVKTADELLDTLTVKQGRQPETTELSDTREKSLNLIKSILSQVKTYQLANLASQASDLGLVSAYVNQYLKPIVKADWSDRTFNLDKMYESLSGDDNLQAAIDHLNMKVLFDELKGLMDSQKTIKETRSESLRRRKRTKTSDVRTTATNALQELFAAIELAQIEHPETDFSEMITGINNSLNFYTAQAKTRNTLNKKKTNSTKDSTGTSDGTKAA